MKPTLPESLQGLGGEYGVIRRIHAVKAAASVAIAETGSAGISVATESEAPIVLGTVAILWVAGETLYTLYNWRNQPQEQLSGRFTRWLVKEDITRESI